MNILTLVIKSTIINALSEQIAASEIKDAHPGLLSSMPGSFFKRDTDLSMIKLGLLRKLRKLIKDAPEESDDQVNVKLLSKYLRTFKKRIEKESRDKNHPSGTTEGLLKLLITFSESFYRKASELKLTNRPNGAGAFAHFIKSVCLYYAHKTIYDIKAAESLITKGVEHPAVTNIMPFHQALDHLIDAMLVFAYANLGGQQKTDMALFTSNEDSLGAVCLELLLFRREALDSQLTIPASISSLSRYLEKCLLDAQQEVKEEKTTSVLPAFVDTAVAGDIDMDFEDEEVDEVEEETATAALS